MDQAQCYPEWYDFTWLTGDSAGFPNKHVRRYRQKRERVGSAVEVLRLHEIDIFPHTIKFTIVSGAISGTRALFYSRIIWLAAFALAVTPATAGENYAERQILPIKLGVGSDGFFRHMNQPATADLNGDGLQDVVIHIETRGAAEANPIKILLNDGAGSLVD